jgi:protein O-GlcNAc transferase
VYHNNVAEDAVSARLRRLARQWHAVAGMDDAQLSGLILGEGIDILFDLSGHTAGNRLPVFARKPAPVQVSWLGYPATTGVAAVDYYWADRFLAPPGLDDPYFTEKIVRLPAVSRFLPEHDAPPLNPLPARSKGYFTFASFNRASKLSHAVVMLWARVLQAVPHSRLLLGALDNESMRGELLRQFAENGIPAGRMILHLRTDKQSYLRLHHEVDLLLDTFPYSGGTTSAHALWMGVPTLTMTGASLSSRQSATLLLHADLPGFIAKDESEFVALAAAWPERLEELDGIRASLRARIADSPMFDVAMIARGAERAATMMWQRWCDGLDPESFEVK